MSYEMLIHGSFRALDFESDYCKTELKSSVM